MKRKLYLGIALTLILTMVLASAALADNIQNDVTANVSDTFTAGGNATVGYRIAANSGDGEPNCNAKPSSPAVVTINTPSEVTATPSSLTFTACGTYQYVVFSSTTPGDYEITVSVSDSGPGSYNLNPAKFTLHVLTAPPSDTTPPVILPIVNGTLGLNGWYTSDVTVSWNVYDDESSVSMMSGCDPTTIDYETTGVTLTCTATSLGGTSTESVTIKVDKTGPTAALSAAGTLGNNGWYISDVTISTTGADDISSPVTCTTDQFQTSDTTGATFNGSCTNDAGLTTAAEPLTVKRDVTPPTISALVYPDPASSGWYNESTGAPTAEFDCQDATAGIEFCEAPYTFGEGLDLTFTGSATDFAGNSATATAGPVNVDLTDPTLTWNIGINDNDSFYFGFVPAYPPNPCLAADALSGPDGCTVTGYSTLVGSHTLTATANDVAGNEYSEYRTYSVLAWTLKGFYQPVDMNGVWNTVKGGSTVPLKFEVFAGPTELTDIAVVAGFTVKGVVCPGGSVATDDIELTTTGGTTLRYDFTAGQFIQNWQTPKKPGACYVVTMTTLDGSTLSANFKLK